MSLAKTTIAMPAQDTIVTAIGSYEALSFTQGATAVNLGRTFFVVLSDATAPVVRATAICTIVDYDAPPRRRAAR